MIGRFIEITESGFDLHLRYGSLIVYDSHGTLRDQIDLDEVLGIICYPHGSMLSAALMSELAMRGIPLVVSNHAFSPSGILLPVIGHHEQSKRLESQIQLSIPRRKAAWANIVRAKLHMQALALDVCGKPSGRVRAIAGEVKSGDTSNAEAQGARVYWRELFGPAFRRERETPGINSLLNYGYAVLRATLARFVVASGLHPGIAIFHRNALNGLRLVDDLMEPFRPLVDIRVSALVRAGFLTVDPKTKRLLVDVMSTDLPHPRGTTPVSVAARYAAISFANHLRDKSHSLEFPIHTNKVDYLDFHSLPPWSQA